MRKKIILLLFIVFSLLTPSHTYAGNSANNYIKNIRYGTFNNGTRVVFDLSNKTDFRAFTLNDPYRVVIDMPKLKWKHPKSGFLSGNKLIKDYRSGELDNGLTRVVFDLKEPALINKAFHLNKGSNSDHRLVLDIKKASKNYFAGGSKEIFGNKNLGSSKHIKEERISATLPNKAIKKKEKTIRTVPTTKITSNPKEIRILGGSKSYGETQERKLKIANPIYKTPEKPKKKPKYVSKDKHVIVIDAGHGGADPGATLNGYYEKNITLAIAKILRKEMLESGRYKVVMTRDKDKYIKLKDRKEIARKSKADLFISIHADSIARKNVRGASIYTLSENASDAETARLAESENNAGYVAGVDLGHESQEVADILLDLAMRGKMNESNMFAKMLEKALRGDKVRLLSNAHRSAGFAVLKAPDVPSVLIEVGFLSNKREAKLLSTYSFQKKVSKAVLNGTDKYFRKIEALQKF